MCYALGFQYRFFENLIVISPAAFELALGPYNDDINLNIVDDNKPLPRLIYYGKLF